MKFCIVSAHFGGEKPWTNQIKSKHDCKFIYYDDNNMPGRENAMHPRLKSKVPKMLAWRHHKADWYIWMDSSVIIKPGVDLAQCVLDTANGNPLCLFKHTKLNRIQDEVRLVKQAVKSNVEYFERRFKGEPILSQVNHYLSDKEFTDNKEFNEKVDKIISKFTKINPLDLYSCDNFVPNKDVPYINWFYLKFNLNNSHVEPRIFPITPYHTDFHALKHLEHKGSSMDI